MQSKASARKQEPMLGLIIAANCSEERLGEIKPYINDIVSIDQSSTSLPASMARTQEALLAADPVSCSSAKRTN